MSNVYTFQDFHGIYIEIDFFLIFLFLFFRDWPYDPPRGEVRDRRKGHKVDRIAAEKYVIFHQNFHFRKPSNVPLQNLK